MQRRIDEINKKISPFFIMCFGMGKYGLSLDADGGYQDEVFDKWANLNNEPIFTDSGLRHFGSGYDWENIFKLCIKETLGINETDPALKYDSEAGLFCVYSKDVELLERAAIQFASIAADKDEFLHCVENVLCKDDSRPEEEEVYVSQLPQKQQDIIYKALQEYGLISYDLERAMRGWVSELEEIIPVDKLLKKKEKTPER